MFEDATFDSRGVVPDHAPQWMMMTAAANCAVVAMLIVVPLLYPHGLPERLLRRMVYAPMEKPVRVVQQAESQPAVESAPAIANPVTAPPRIHATGLTNDAPPEFVGEIGDRSFDGKGELPGALTTVFPKAAPIAVAKPETHAAVKISGGVSEGLLLTRTNPSYPVIARNLRISGMVVLAATISAQGRIENLQVVSGHPMLREAALEAVKSWRYRPYLLNGEPVEVETTIHINFTLGQP